MDIISNNVNYGTANNHILNTLSMKFFEFLFGSNDLALRLQSILAHIIFMFTSYHLLKNIKSPIIFAAGFLLLNLNPYMFDFFSLARGYTLAISFMLISIYYFFDFIKEEKNKSLWITLITACLAVLSNFALFNFLATMLLLIELNFILKYFKSTPQPIKFIIKKNIPIFIIIAIMGAICFEPIRKLIKFNALYFGGNNGVWQDTVGSLVQKYTYNISYNFDITSPIKIIIIISLVSYATLLIYNLYKTNLDLKNNRGALFFLILASMVSISIIQHILIGTMFFMERFAIFFIPVFMFVFVYFFNTLFNHKKLFSYLSVILIISITSLFSLHFYNTINISYCDDWRYDADIKTMLKDLEPIAKKDSKTEIKLAVEWYNEPAINFYKSTQKLTWLSEVEREGDKNKSYDFYFLSKEELSLYKHDSGKVVKEYPVSGRILWQ